MTVRALFALATITAALVAYNHWPRPVDTTVRHGNHDGARWAEIACGPGPRVLVVGGSVANGWGASSLAHEWWVIACHRVGGTWRNAAQPARRIADEAVQVEENRGFRAERVVHLTGGNDLVLGLAPGIRGQVARRAERFREGVGALRLETPGTLVVLQPIDLSGAHPALQTAGYEADLARAYAEMARAADVDLSALPVDFLDVLHFSDAGHALLADRIEGIFNGSQSPLPSQASRAVDRGVLPADLAHGEG